MLLTRTAIQCNSLGACTAWRTTAGALFSLARPTYTRNFEITKTWCSDGRPTLDARYCRLGPSHRFRPMAPQALPGLQENTKTH